MPVSIASFTSGSAGRRSRATGCISRASAALSVRKGRCTGKESMPAWKAGWEREIVSLSASVSADSASNVIAVRVKRSAWVSATGATVRAVLPTARKRRPRRVRRLDRLRVTGARWPNSRGSSSRLEFTDWPRPARALPKPWMLRWMPVRVLAVEGPREVVDLHRDRRLVLGEHVAVFRHAVGGAAHQLQVLEAER